MDGVESVDKSKIPNQDDEKHEGSKNNNFEDAYNEEENEERDEEEEMPRMRQETFRSVHGRMDGWRDVSRIDLI